MYKYFNFLIIIRFLKIFKWENMFLTHAFKIKLFVII